MGSPPGFIRLFWAFFRLGLTAFGGPAMVRYIKELSCKKYKWVDPKEFDQGIALVQTIPGATAMQAAAYAGLKARGGLGAIVSFTGFALPAFILMVILAWAYQKAMNISFVVSCFVGLKVVVVAIVANATLDFGKKMIKSWQDIFLMAASAIYLFLKGSPIVAIGACAIGGIFLYRDIVGKSDSRPTFHDTLKSPQVRSIIAWAGFVALVAIVVILMLFVTDPFLARLGLLMMKIDFFAYGGGYASLPLMLHEIVEKRAFLPKEVFMDGIALGQVTPGPIVITAAFVGFMLKGLLGAIVCSWAIFTPSLFMLMFSSPFYDGFKEAPFFKKAMKGVLASFVGLLLAVFLSFFMAIKWNLAAALIGIGAFYALYKGIDILWVVIVAATISSVIL